MNEVTLIENRVDWFEARARVAFTRARLATPDAFDVVEIARETAKRAKRNGSAPFRIGQLVFGEMRPPTRPGLYRIVNADYLLELDLLARERSSDGEGTIEGWNARVQWRASCLAERGFDPGLMRDLFAELGQVLEWKMARVDAAATFAGWLIAKDDREALVVRSRAKVADMLVSQEPENDVEPASGKGGKRQKKKRRNVASVFVTTHGRALPTGFTVGAGGDVHARVYDKIAELVVKGDIRRDPETGAVRPKTRKGEIECAIWKAAGIDLDAPPPITRVEFQIRGQAIEELGIKDPKKVRERLGPIWRYLTGTARTKEAKGHGGWMRLVRTETTRKKRAKLDPRWEAVRAVEWDRTGEVAKRIRHEAAGAHWKQAVGAAFGAIAQAGFEVSPILAQFKPQFEAELDKLRAQYERKGHNPWSAYRKAYDEAMHTRMQRIDPYVLRKWIENNFVTFMTELALLATDSLIAERGAAGAAEWFATKCEAVRLRFGRVEFEAWQAAEREREDRLRNGIHPFVLYEKKMAG